MVETRAIGCRPGPRTSTTDRGPSHPAQSAARVEHCRPAAGGTSAATGHGRRQRQGGGQSRTDRRCRDRFACPAGRARCSGHPSAGCHGPEGHGSQAGRRARRRPRRHSHQERPRRRCRAAPDRRPPSQHPRPGRPLRKHRRRSPTRPRRRVRTTTTSAPSTAARSPRRAHRSGRLHPSPRPTPRPVTRAGPTTWFLQGNRPLVTGRHRCRSRHPTSYHPTNSTQSSATAR